MPKGRSLSHQSVTRGFSRRPASYYYFISIVSTEEVVKKAHMDWTHGGCGWTLHALLGKLWGKAVQLQGRSPLPVSRYADFKSITGVVIGG